MHEMNVRYVVKYPDTLQSWLKMTTGVYKLPDFSYLHCASQRTVFSPEVTVIVLVATKWIFILIHVWKYWKIIVSDTFLNLDCNSIFYRMLYHRGFFCLVYIIIHFTYSIHCIQYLVYYLMVLTVLLIELY